MLNREKLHLGVYRREGMYDACYNHIEPLCKLNVKCEEELGDGKFRVVKAYGEGEDVITEEVRTENALYARSVITNNTEKDIPISHISSFAYTGIETCGEKKWWSKDRFIVHYPLSTWQGEAQWRHASVYELGLYPASNHRYRNLIEFRSVGSLATNFRHPVLILEDTELKKSYFFELEAGCSWEMSIIAMGYGEGATLAVEGSCAAELNDAWFKNLKPGESYEVKGAIAGVACGGFEEAVRALTDIRRKIQINRFKIKPAAFNDYMCCLWARPTKERLLPLIDKAAEVGCETFVIDAGWYKCPPEDWGAFGDWIPDDGKFDEMGFSGIIDYIKSKGMNPGCWLEVEAIFKANPRFKERYDLVLKRNGAVIGGSRGFVDFREKELRDFIEAAIDNLYNMGIRFIKNDYNQSLAIGLDGDDSYSEALADHSKAVSEFFTHIQKKYPDLIIEACGSGGLRSDLSVLRQDYLESLSDQEYYYMNPSILVGSAACYLPEKAGSWSYPYPLPYEHRSEKFADYFKDKLHLFADGEETAFNMINSILGVMYLSGHIEFADEKNTALISEAVEVYKATREEFVDAYPAFITEPFGITDELIAAYGLESEGGMLVAVWKIGTDETSAEFDLTKYGAKSAELIYPKTLGTTYTFEDGKLKISDLDKKYMARLFYVKK